MVNVYEGRLDLLPFGGSRIEVYFNPDERIGEAAISADSQRILFTSVWVSEERQFLRLRLFDRQTKQATTLVESLGDVLDPVWSDDGETILFRCAAGGEGPIQAWTIRRDGSGLRRVTQDDYGIQKAILSGDGSIVFAHTLAEGVIRADLSSGEQSYWIPNTFTFNVNQPLVSGSSYRLEGTHLSLIRGFRGSPGVPDAPILARSENSIVLQIPWEALLANNLVLDVDQESTVVTGYPFASRAPVFAVRGQTPLPVFFSLAADTPAARPGDVVSVFGSGFGPVDPAVPTGSVTPSGAALSRLKESVVCRTRDDGQAVPVLFAGLAPGLIGVYQVNLQIPANAQTPPYSPNLYEVVCSQTAMVAIPFRPNR